MGSQLTQRGSLDAESEMSPQEPPPWIVRTTAWILVGAFLFALLIAIVMRLPETVHCRFILIPATGADPIQSPRQAIISRVAVEEGQPVKAGENLFGSGAGTPNSGRSPKIYTLRKKASPSIKLLTPRNLR